MFWDKRVLELVDMEFGLFSISSWFRNCVDGFQWMFTGVYGPVVDSSRESFWEEFGFVRGLWNIPWCVDEGFNVVCFPCERWRGGRVSSSMRRFSKVIEDLELRDIPLQGGPFTWRGVSKNWSMSRIDRFLVSNDWESHFSNVIQSTLPRPTSNHCPILLGLREGGIRMGPNSFHFENM